MTFDIRTAFRGDSAVKWLVLAALAWSQLALASHQLEHDAAEPTEECGVCVTFDRDDTIVDDQAFTAAPATTDSVSVVVVAAAPTTAPTFFRARASP